MTSRKVKQVTDHAKVLEDILGVKGDYRSGLNTYLGRALPRSCQWLHRRASFRQWFDASDEGHHILWIAGLPGMGKTTLAAKTVHHI